MITLRLFPFITSLPLGVIQAQGEIKTIVKVHGIFGILTWHLTVHDQQIASRLVERESNETSHGSNHLLSLLSEYNLWFHTMVLTHAAFCSACRFRREGTDDKR